MLLEEGPETAGWEGQSAREGSMAHATVADSARDHGPQENHQFSISQFSIRQRTPESGGREDPRGEGGETVHQLDKSLQDTA